LYHARLITAIHAHWNEISQYIKDYKPQFSSVLSQSSRLDLADISLRKLITMTVEDLHQLVVLLNKQVRFSKQSRVLLIVQVSQSLVDSFKTIQEIGNAQLNS
jgi:hypothetical protein